jgi:hypothetical protein
MGPVSALLSVAGLCGCLVVTSVAHAETANGSSRDEPTSSASLSVVREEGAETCPDAEALSERVAALRGRLGTGTRSTYQVTFGLRDGAYQAAIHLRGGVRLLADRGPTCASLEQATAVTLALLFDSDAQEPVATEPEESEKEPPLTPPAPPVPLPPAEPPPRPRRVALSASLGGAALLGVVRTAAPSALADVGLVVNRFHTSVGALWVPTQKLTLPPGQLSETLVAGVFRACYAPLAQRALRLEVCTGIYAGSVRVRAAGYTRNDVVDRTWLAVPVELSVSVPSSPLGVELGVSALLPLRQSDFGVDHLGTAFASWPVGALLSLRVVGNVPLLSGSLEQ